MSGRLVWPALLAVGTIAEFRSLRRKDGCTLSECTRDAFRVHTPIGRAAFTAVLIAGPVAYWRHIVKPLAEEVGKAIEEATL